MNTALPGVKRPALILPLVCREWKNGSNSSYNCTPFLHSLLTKGKSYILLGQSSPSSCTTFRQRGCGYRVMRWGLHVLVQDPSLARNPTHITTTTNTAPPPPPPQPPAPAPRPRHQEEDGDIYYCYYVLQLLRCLLLSNSLALAPYGKPCKLKP